MALLEEGETLAVVREDLVEFAGRVRGRLMERQDVEPGELLSRERGRFV